MTGPAEFTRQYLAADADLGTWPTAEKYYRELADRHINSPADLDIWLCQWSELEAFVDEERARRRMEAARFCEDEGRQAHYQAFLRTVMLPAEHWRLLLTRKLLEQANRLDLPPMRYDTLLRRAQAAAELYREENLPLLAQEACLIAQYRRLTATMTCEYAGREQTPAQMAWYLENPDRKVREQAWRLMAERFYQDSPQLDELYAQLVRLRDQIARQAGCADYVQYIWKLRLRADYTPADCRRLNEAIRRAAVPQVGRLNDSLARRLKVSDLRPWDLMAPPSGDPLPRFSTAAELIRACGRVFYRMDPELGRVFDTLEQRQLLDLEPRAGKLPGNFHEILAGQRLPVIFMNATGCEHDFWTLLYEAGHAFFTWACRSEPLLAYRNVDAVPEAAELAGIALQFLTLPHLKEVFGDHTNATTKAFLERLIRLLPCLARIDAFEHYVYQHPHAAVEDWKDCWQKLGQRLGLSDSFSEFEQFERHGWQQQVELFEAPLSCVEYEIGVLGAAQLWEQAQRDYQHAVALYRNGLALGAALPAVEVFSAAGCRLELTSRSLAQMIGAIINCLRSSGSA